MRPGGARHVPGRRALSATVAQAAILMGGLAGRPGAGMAAMPDPLLPCGDRPFLAWLIRELVRFGVTDVLLLTGHGSAVLEAALPAVQATLPRPVRIAVSEAPAGAGTGGALHHARDLLQERFLVCGGDRILDFNLARLLADAAAEPGPRIVLCCVADAGRDDLASLAGGRVTALQPRAAAPGPGLATVGIHLLDRSILPSLSPACSLVADVLPALAAAGALGGTVASGFVIDIGAPGGPDCAPTAVPARFTRPALFLDRDGTINRDHGWVGTRDRWEWIDGAKEAVCRATAAGWHVFVVTNQSGIARGYYDEAALETLHGWMTDEIRRAGGTVDDIRFCPFHEEAGIGRYRRASDWRKPGPGMVLDLLARWGCDPARCVLVGDQPSDMAAAAAAGVRGQLFAGGNLLDLVAPLLG